MLEKTELKIKRSPSGYALADHVLFKQLEELGKWYKNYMGSTSIGLVVFLIVILWPVIWFVDNGWSIIAVIILIIGVGSALVRYKYGWKEVRSRFSILTRRRSDIGFVGSGGLKIYRYWISGEAIMDSWIKENLEKKTWGEVVETPPTIRLQLMPRKKSPEK